MTELLGCIALSLVLVLAFRQRPVVWISVGILSAVFLPLVATRAYLLGAGGLGRIHPSAWIFLVGFVVTTVCSPLRRTVPRRRTLLVVLVVLWVAATGAIVVRQTGFGSLQAFVVCYLTPPLAFLAIHAATTREDAALWKKLVPVVLVAAALQSVLALVQLLTHTSLLFNRYYATNYWWNEYLERAIGTFDSPLDLAAFLTMAIPLTATLRRTPAALTLAALLAVGVVVSGSRTGVVMAAVVIVWIVFVRSSNAIPAILTSLTLLLATGVLLASPLASTLLSRFGFGGDASTQARTDAFAIGSRLAADDLVGGHGSGFAYSYSRALLDSSFENAYLATAIDFGLLVALAFVVLQLWAVFTGRSERLLFRVSGVLAVVWGFSYSSFVSTSTFGTLSWVFIALAGIDGYRGLVPIRQTDRRVATAGSYVAVRPATPRTLVGKT